MQPYTNHNEISTMLAHFNAAFDNFVIKRFEKDGDVQSSIAVRYIHGPKSAVAADLIQNKTNVSLPLVNTYVTGSGRDASRVTAATSAQQFSSNLHSRQMTNVAPAQPFNIELGMTMYAKYNKDIDQMITNFVPYFDPYIMLSWKHPITGQEIQMKAVWNEQLTHEYPDNLEPTAPWQYGVSTSFTLEGWLFKGDQRPIGRILNIYSTFTPVKTIECDYANLVAYQNEETSDCFAILGLPKPIASSVTCIRQNVSTPISIFGQMFKNVTGVYVSAGPGVVMTGTSAMSVFNPASSSTMALCSAFSGVPIAGFIASQIESLSDPAIKSYLELWEDLSVFSKDPKVASHPWNMLSFEIPPLSGSGYIDIIVTNPAGCNTLSMGSYLDFSNPYREGTAEHASWVAPQYPWYQVGIGVGAYESVEPEPS